jgi:membrane associated rhomboid family serine protease
MRFHLSLALFVLFYIFIAVASPPVQLDQRPSLSNALIDRDPSAIKYSLRALIHDAPFASFLSLILVLAHLIPIPTKDTSLQTTKFLSEAQYHRLATHMFVHNNWTSLGPNLFALWAIIARLEKSIGYAWLAFFAFSLVTAIHHLRTTSDVYAAGAGGGLLGVQSYGTLMHLYAGKGDAVPGLALLVTMLALFKEYRLDPSSYSGPLVGFVAGLVWFICSLPYIAIRDQIRKRDDVAKDDYHPW